MKTEERPKNSRGYIRWTDADRKQLLKEYAGSGQTKKEFCRERGINIGTFYGWAKEACKRGKKPKVSKPKFREVNVPVAAGHSVEIILPGGARVCLRDNGNGEDLAKLIRGIAGC